MILNTFLSFPFLKDNNNNKGIIIGIKYLPCTPVITFVPILCNSTDVHVMYNAAYTPMTTAIAKIIINAFVNLLILIFSLIPSASPIANKLRYIM